MKIEIRGGHPLVGQVTIDGCKHSALPILGASLLTEEEVVLSNVPSILDVNYLLSWISKLCATISRERNSIIIKPAERTLRKPCLPSYFTSCLHSTYVLWPGLALRFGEFKSGLPGGCRIGERPVTEILEILEAFGIETIRGEEDISFRLRRLRSPKRLYLNRYSIKARPSVTKTALLMASRLNGVTELIGAFVRPEIVDLALFLTELGAEIEGIGTEQLRIRGQADLGKAYFEIRPDPIEAGSYAAMAIATRGDVTLQGILIEDLRVEMEYFTKMGLILENSGYFLRINASQEVRPISVPFTHPPGLCTDTVPCLVAALTVVKGVSRVRETVWEERFAYIRELQKMGARIEIDSAELTIYGVESLHGAEVIANDLRGAAALITAGLAASGRTCVNNAYHVMRGYSDIIGKLTALGADVIISA